MTADEVKTTPPAKEQRGAGTGENAVAQRSRRTQKDPAEANDLNEMVRKAQAEAVKNNQKFADETEEDLEETEPDIPEPGPVTEYPEGDPDKGALDPENPHHLIAHRDRRAYLLRQAQRNEAANDQLNAIQIAQNRRVAALPSLLNDPDYLREVSMQTAQTALMTHDPDTVREKREQALELQKRRTAQAEKENKAAAR
jgi:hypothetical protein